MIKKLLVIGSLFIAILQPAYAIDSSPSADIKVKLEELKKEIASKAAKLKQEVDRKLKDKAYVGKIKSKSGGSLTVATRSGPKIVSINQDTILPRTAIKEEDYIAALGDVDETAVLTAKKIILLKPITEEPKTYIWGKVISISEKLVTLKDKSSKNISATFPDLSKVRLNNLVISTGSYNKNRIFEAKFVYVAKP